MEGSTNFDINQDGSPDFSGNSGPAIGTMDVPMSFAETPFYFVANGTNEFQVSTNGYVRVQPFDSWIAPFSSGWGSPSETTLLTTYWWSPRNQTEGWYGDLGTVGAGYVGVRFYAADGLHFGWIRVRLPGASPMPGGLPELPTPIVVDWAYEAKPNTPIRVGEIDSSRESMQFVLEFRNEFERSRHADRLAGSGSFILTGDTLTCEISLNGSFPSLEIRNSPAVSRKTSPVFTIDQALEVGPGLTTFFAVGDLSALQERQLLRDDFYIVANGRVLGRIVPDPANRR